MSAKLHVTDHAVERYQARVKPAADLHVAKAELLALLAVGERTERPPDWHRLVDPTTDFIELSDGILAIVRGRTVMTVVTRAETSDERRRAKNRRKAQKRSAKRLKSASHARRGRPTQEPSWEA